MKNVPRNSVKIKFPTAYEVVNRNVITQNQVEIVFLCCFPLSFGDIREIILAE